MDFKELYLSEHERLIDEYMETHPGVTWDQAYERCADGAYDGMRDRLADMADAARQQMKDEG